MRLLVNENQPPEIAVVGNQDASFTIGNAKNLRIGQTGWIVARNSGDIVPKRGQVRDGAPIGALVQQEPHALLWASSALRLLEAARASFLSGDFR